jgi:hypothetical protein
MPTLQYDPKSAIVFAIAMGLLTVLFMGFGVYVAFH